MNTQSICPYQFVELGLWQAAHMVSVRPAWSAGSTGCGRVAWQPRQMARPAWSAGCALGAVEELVVLLAGVAGARVAGVAAVVPGGEVAGALVAPDEVDAGGDGAL